MRVAIVMGSTSDLPKVEPAITILNEYGANFSYVLLTDLVINL